MPPAPEVQRVSLPCGDGLHLSGLFADTAKPRGLLVALHGGGQRAEYFHDPLRQQDSLLLLGKLLGYSVLALDRPGYGASVGIAEQNTTLAGQASAIWRALRQGSGFGSTLPMMLLGHSFGAMVALQMAVRPPPMRVVGIDVSGVGTRYADAVLAKNPKTYVADELATRSTRGREDAVDPTPLRISPLPQREPYEALAWPARVDAIAAAVSVPITITVGEHDRTWINSPEHFGALFVNAKSVALKVQPHSGHNISLGSAARAYHLQAIAFFDNCLIAQ
ncbi:alpha/beta hydrolase [Mycobacterium colombiense]